MSNLLHEACEDVCQRAGYEGEELFDILQIVFGPLLADARREGAEEMREAAAKVPGGFVDTISRLAARRILALPLPPEGKP